MISYNESDDPTESGVYACRVPSATYPGLHTDIFLMWIDGKWGYLGSDQRYRGQVSGWVGPLQRRLKGVPG